MTRDDSTRGRVRMGGGGLSNASARKKVIFEDKRKPDYLICGKRISDKSPSQPPRRRRAFWREEEDAVEKHQRDKEEDTPVEKQEEKKKRPQLKEKRRQLLREKRLQLLQEKEQLEKEIHEIQEKLAKLLQKNDGKKKALCSDTLRLVSIAIRESNDFDTTESIRNRF